MTKTNPTEPTATKRDDFSPKIKETLARRAGYRCSICKEPTVGPHSNPDKAAFLGEASHIHSAAPNGPRANNCLSPEERASASNGIHLCKKHARLVDVDEEQYTAEKLRQIKNNHEQEIRSMLAGQSHDYDRDFLNSHETQLIHGRGNPTLADLWVSRHLIQPEVGTTPIKHDVAQINTSESGIYLITSDQTTGRTSLLKRMVSEALGRLHCVWLDGRNISESIVKDPVKALAEGYSTINPNADGWQLFLEADREQNRRTGATRNPPVDAGHVKTKGSPV